MWAAMERHRRGTLVVAWGTAAVLMCYVVVVALTLQLDQAQGGSERLSDASGFNAHSQPSHSPPGGRQYAPVPGPSSQAAQQPGQGGSSSPRPTPSSTASSPHAKPSPSADPSPTTPQPSPSHSARPSPRPSSPSPKPPPPPSPSPTPQPCFLIFC